MYTVALSDQLLIIYIAYPQIDPSFDRSVDKTLENLLLSVDHPVIKNCTFFNQWICPLLTPNLSPS